MSTSVPFIILPVTEPPATVQNPQTGTYESILSIDGKPIVTVTVLMPYAASGFSYNRQVVAPNAPPITVDGFVLSAHLNPNQIQFVAPATPAVPTPDPTPDPSTDAATTSNTARVSVPTSTSNKTTGPTPTTASLPATADSGLGTGAIAGIAVGCLVAGALLAGFILWFCWRKRRQPKNHYPQPDTYALASQEKGFSANTIPLAGKLSSGAALGGGLPQPLEDKAISGDVSKISNAIKNHVQSYYHTSRVNPGLIDYEDLQALGPGLPVSVGTLTTLIGNAATREIALRFIIAWVIVSKLQPSKDPSKSLLPSEVAQCYQAVATGDRGFQAQTSLMARWRVMTAELMQASYIRNPFGPSDSRHASIQATLATLDNVLQPYADSRMNNGERKRNLEEVLKRAALFAFTLFSQPSAWEFEWQEEEGVTSGDLCIFPALVQVADEAGHPVSPPRPFSEAVVRRLDA
ncbi:uncharacterized protein J4E79_003920 [Alternaria viburni]|uniref:uncharacterized protein n=1 Tax=Alternaria viburni TaxID=566460 RepID=UPI0020C35B3F|nr:uncharacterized protein J4E79_003920 [Alternaria viburni]KAI4664416.1 hypothetical protein J4E79_003920 [Alternaria viburni]